MPESWRHHLVRSFARVAVVAGVGVFAVVAAGCGSTPVRAYRGAQHYAAGTDALARSDGALAIALLERAAALVPQASEIQNHLGLAYWSDGRTQAAKAAFAKAIELDCDNFVAQANFARLVHAKDFDVDVDERGEGAGEVDANDR